MARYSMLPVVLLVLLPLALARPDDAVSAARPRRTSAPKEWSKWRVCEMQCDKKAYSQCDERDIFCNGICSDSCVCGCIGHPAGTGNYTPLTIEYLLALDGCSKKCVATYHECDRACNEQFACHQACLVDKTKCDCDCMDEAQATVASGTLPINSYIFFVVLLASIIVVFVGLTLLKINNKK